MTIYLQRGDKGRIGDGIQGDWIVSWQAFLAGEGHYVGDYSPNFGPKTQDATEQFQNASARQMDGLVGAGTTAAAVGQGFDPPWIPRSESAFGKEYDLDIANDPDYPQPDDLDGDGGSDLVYLSGEAREELWGAPLVGIVDGKPVVDNAWRTDFIRKVHVPQIVGLDVYGSRSSGNVQFHKLAAAQLLGAMQECEDAGVLEDITSYGGSYNFRFIRGSTTTLSNHAYGVALDFNMKENGLGKQPALVGEAGTLRRIVKTFERYGAFWGGWYRNRKDGMHFEFVKVIPTAELEGMIRGLNSFDHILPWLKDVA